MINKFAIVAIGYNRVNSIARLLNSLELANYDDDKVTLIISIDNSGSTNVEEYARNFKWSHGPVEIKTYPKRQGLRKHVLICGNFVKDYDAIAVFEDDIVAAPGFYQYMKSAVAFYQADERIAGISLYNHMWNVNAIHNFVPEPGEYDVYFLQFAQSWGQIWMKKQWLDFVAWYENNKDEIKPCTYIPGYVTAWPENSWLKYHIKYCIEKSKYFVYPYTSLSTCFEDVGEHCKFKNTVFQVPISNEVKEKYNFISLDNAKIIYDAFFEREHLGKYLNISDNDLCVDLYGTKSLSKDKRYYLTMKPLNYKVIRSYALELKPQELNVMWGLKGNDIYLYDLSCAGTAPKVGNIVLKQFKYYEKLDNQNRRLFTLLSQNIKDKVINKFKKKSQ